MLKRILRILVNEAGVVNLNDDQMKQLIKQGQFNRKEAEDKIATLTIELNTAHGNLAELRAQNAELTKKLDDVCSVIDQLNKLVGVANADAVGSVVQTEHDWRDIFASKLFQCSKCGMFKEVGDNHTKFHRLIDNNYTACIDTGCSK